MINSQISEYSCDKNHFDKPAPDYKISLKRSGFNENVIYISSPSKRQTRSRQIICFNTLYTANVKTNVGKMFMRLIDKHFSRHHKYYKLFNRSNIILSCSCMPNMNNHPEKNCKLMNNPAPSTTKTCNCRRKKDCPMDDYCLFECLIYKASVSTTNNKYNYSTCENTLYSDYIISALLYPLK